MIYTYRCKCGRTELDRDFPMGKAPEGVASCIICFGEVRRVFQLAGVQFKGTGFYSTDNRKGYILPEHKKEMEEKRGHKLEDFDG